MRKAARAVFFGLSILALAGLVPNPAHAAEPGWANLPYKYIIIDEDIKDALTEFGRNIKVSTKISPAVGGRRIRGSGTVQKLTALSFLQNLCDSYGLVWYFDGTVLNISANEEVNTELVKLNDVEGTAVLRRIADLGLSNRHFAVRATEDGHMISVSGPPAYRSQIKELVMKLQNNYQERPTREIKLEDTPKVRVFRGSAG